MQYFKNAEKVLILPSSFCQCDEFIKCLDERFTVFCREQQSYNYLKNANTKAEIILDHDMAFRLDTSIFKYKDFVLNFDAFRALNNLCSFLLKTPNTFNVAYFLRKDCEKAYDYPSDMDLSNLIGGNEFSSREHIMLCAILMLCIVDKFNAVVTDRLHVGIASVLMGKTVYLLDNSYKKLSSVYNHSLKNNKNVHFVTALPLNITASQTTSNNLIKLFNVIGHIYKIPRFIFL